MQEKLHPFKVLSELQASTLVSQRVESQHCFFLTSVNLCSYWGCYCPTRARKVFRRALLLCFLLRRMTRQEIPLYPPMHPCSNCSLVTNVLYCFLYWDFHQFGRGKNSHLSYRGLLLQMKNTINQNKTRSQLTNICFEAVQNFPQGD